MSKTLWSWVMIGSRGEAGGIRGGIGQLGAVCLGFSLAIILMPGCQSEPVPSTTQIDTLETGTVFVRNGEEGLWDRDEGWTLEEILRLGATEGDGPEVFGHVSQVTLDAWDRVWIYEAQAAEVRVFDRSGNHLRTFGGPGEGPGEFTSVAGLLWSPRNQLWTIDQQNGRISVFDTTGTFIRSHAWIGSSFFSHWPGIIDGMGRFYDVVSDLQTGQTMLVRQDSLLRTIDTLAVPVHPNGPGVYCHTGERGTGCAGVPYAGTVAWALTEDGGLWAAITDQYRLLHLNPMGDTIRVVTKSFTPEPLEGQEREEVAVPLFFGEPMPRSALPSVKPAISRVLLDDTGHVWVIRWADDEDQNAPVDVFDPRGVYLGTMTSPVDLDQAPVFVRAGSLVAVARDALDVPYVVVYEIAR